MSSCSESKTYESGFEVVAFSINKNLYFVGGGIDFYREAILPRPELDYENISLVGRTKYLADRCAAYRGSYICPCAKTRKSVVYYCKRVACEICFHKVITRQIIRIGQRLEKYESLTGSPLEMDHYTFNINDEIHVGKERILKQEIYNTMDKRLVQNWIIRIIKKYGFTGIIIFHPYRKDKAAMEFNGGVPALKKSGHFHLVGNFENLPKSNDFYEKYKFTYKNISAKKYSDAKETRNKMEDQEKREKLDIDIPLKKHLMGVEPVLNVLKYLLTHSGSYERNSQNYSYIGKLSSYYLKKVNEQIDYEVSVCDDCNEALGKVSKEITISIDGLLVPKKAYELHHNAGGFNQDIAIYDKRDLSVDYDDNLVKKIIDYDLEFRIHKPKVKKSCSDCKNQGKIYEGCSCNYCKLNIYAVIKDLKSSKFEKKEFHSHRSLGL